MVNFYKALNFTLKNEGLYSNDSRDPGGETKYGISKKSYPNVDIKNLTLDQATAIYLRDYWEQLYNNLSAKLAVRLFDLSVNLGKKKAIALLQRCLNQYYKSDLAEDGMYGPLTHRKTTEVDNHNLHSLLLFEASKLYESFNKPHFFIGWLNRLYKKI